MAEEIVRDQTGRKIGTLETRPDGILVAKDLSGKKVGEYDPDNDVTRDGRGRKVGVGDQLSGCYPPTAEPRLNGLSRPESSDCRN